jgi:taurine--2-oxoglutarate transaminase
VSDRATKEPLAPYGGTSPAMVEFTAECKKRGLMPFVNFNRTHVVPPCTVTDAEAKEGLAILDEVLSITDKHYTG